MIELENTMQLRVNTGKIILTPQFYKTELNEQRLNGKSIRREKSLRNTQRYKIRL
jgi:hypothetical protein